MAMEGRGKGHLDKKQSNLMFMQITPPHIWKEDSLCHYLCITLPGFEKDNITICMDKYGQLVVRGDRRVSDHKYISFEESFQVPNDVDLEESWGAFEDHQIYCMAIPKKQHEQRREHKENSTDVVPEDEKRPTDHHGLRPEQPDNKIEPFGRTKIGPFFLVALVLIVVAAVVGFKSQKL